MKKVISVFVIILAVFSCQKVNAQQYSVMLDSVISLVEIDKPIPRELAKKICFEIKNSSAVGLDTYLEWKYETLYKEGRKISFKMTYDEKTDRATDTFEVIKIYNAKPIRNYIFDLKTGKVKVDSLIDNMETKVIIKMFLPDSLQKPLLEMVHLYTRVYGLSDTITVDLGKDEAYTEKDGIANYLAHASKKSIKITSAGLRLDIKAFKSMILHELFHTLQSEILYDDIAFLFFDGKTYLGSIGFGMRIKKKKTNDTLFFDKIGEASAEACAAVCLSEYTTRHPGYQALGLFMIGMINQKWITTKDLIEMVKCPNAVVLFIAKILDINPSKVGAKEITYFMVLFSEVFENREYKPYVNELKRIRMMYSFDQK